MYQHEQTPAHIGNGTQKADVQNLGFLAEMIKICFDVFKSWASVGVHLLCAMVNRLDIWYII